MARVTLDWIQLAVVVGALQGLLLTGVLLAQRNNRTANRLLGAMMGAFTLYLASAVYYAAGIVRAYPQFFGLSFPVLWLIGPLVYLYTVAASDRSWRMKRRDWLHLLPAAIVTLVAAPYYVMSGAEKLAFYDRVIVGDVPTLIRLLEPTKFISGIGYSAATVLYLRRHRRAVEGSYSNVARVNLTWLLWLAGAAAAIWALATTMQITDFNQHLREEH